MRLCNLLVEPRTDHSSYSRSLFLDTPFAGCVRALSSRLSLLILFFLLVAGTVQAADVDPQWPNDTEVVVSFNVEQALASPIGRRYLRGFLEQSLKSNEQAAALLKEVEFDPAKDISRIVLALSVSDGDKSLVIIRGKFKTEKIAQAAARLAADQKDKLKIHRIAGQNMYEFPGDKESTFAAFVSDSSLVLSPQRATVVAFLEKATDKFGKVKPELARLVAKVDGKQAAWLAALPGFLKKDLPIPQDTPQQKQAMEKIQGATGTVRIENDIRFYFTLFAADAASTQQIAGMVDGVIKLLLFLAPGIVKEKPELAPLQDVLATLRSQSKGQNVTVTAELTAKTLEKMIQAVKP